MSNAAYPPPPPGQQQPPQGWGQQPTGPAWGTPPQQPKKGKAGKILGFGCLGIVGLIVVIGIIGAVLSSGSKGDSSGGSKTVTSSSTPKSNSGAAKGTKTGAEGDVKITACEVEPSLKWPSAKLTITNRSSKTSNYMVQVEFVDKSGTRIGEGVAATNNLAPDQVAKETAQGTGDASGKITCKVTEVTRYAS